MTLGKKPDILTAKASNCINMCNTAKSEYLLEREKEMDSRATSPKFLKNPFSLAADHNKHLDETRIRVAPAVKSNPYYVEHVLVIQDMYDSLPENLKTHIGGIQIEEEPRGRFAFWNHEIGTMYFGLDCLQSVKETKYCFTHELEHVKFHKRLKSHPSKIKQYIVDIYEIGGAPTPYAAIFLEKINEIDEQHAMFVAGALPGKIDVDVEDQYLLKRLFAKISFASESHSETYCVEHGVHLAKCGEPASLEKMDRFIGANHALWDDGK